MVIRIASREGPDQTASSDLRLCCLSRPFWKATSVRNFSTSTTLRLFFPQNGQRYTIKLSAVVECLTRDRGFETHQRLCVVILEQDTFILA